MILLLGGTSESVETARLLVDGGLEFIFSMSTNMFMKLPVSKLITLRRGPMDCADMDRLIRNRAIMAVADATHPYALEVKRNALLACENTGAKYFRLSRSSTAHDGYGVMIARDHEDAAEKASEIGRTVLCATGVRNLGAYVHACKRKGVRLVTRSMPTPESLEIIRSFGIPEEDVIVGKGPYSFEENLWAIRKYSVGALVTKDSGTRGGTEEKIRAAAHEKCAVIIVKRPEIGGSEVFAEPSDLVKALKNYLGATSSNRDGVSSVTML